MCQSHSKIIDADEKEYPANLLRKWKRDAQDDVRQRVLRKEGPPPLNPSGVSYERLRTAAETDLGVFRNTVKWPRTSVALTLKLKGIDEPVTTDALASMVRTLDDLILIAPPGMGKTTTIFQLAEAVMACEGGIPIVLLLNDWATEGLTVLASILRRPAFHAFSEADFRSAAAESGLVLLLDGWNELDGAARERARVQIERLKAEIPELGIAVSTRKQALDVPFSGELVELLPLSAGQQMEIAIGMRGEPGAKIVDEAWRTEGIQELVPIPLYLTALLSLPEDAPFPRTKEEVLRHFVAAHEGDARRAQALRDATKGFQQDYLVGLALATTNSANAAISDTNARRSVSQTVTSLITDGQISIRPEPDTILETLVSNHVLMRAGDTPGISFQHQQFQEWYASHTVEEAIVAAATSGEGEAKLKAEILNLPEWEEPILFAVERMARGAETHKAACGKAILSAFAVDPMLAAEMIYRATDEVWEPIAAPIQMQVRGWHEAGQPDRALRFMMNSGRPEFFGLVWPVITHEDHQVSLHALRNCVRFRSSILGPGAADRIKALPIEQRRILLQEMASEGGMDSLDLVVTIGRDDPEPRIQADIVEALAFRRADRHVAHLLEGAGDATFDLIARAGLIDDVEDESVRTGVLAARERQTNDGVSDYDRLRTVVHCSNQDDQSAALAAIISDMEIRDDREGVVQLIYNARDRYPQALAEGVLARLRTGSNLFHGADDILASAGLAMEEDGLVQIALADTSQHDGRADAAASVLGPQSAGRLIDAMLDAAAGLRDSEGKFDQAASDRFRAIQARIAHVPGPSLLAAVQARSAEADNEQMAYLAPLLSGHPLDAYRGRPFSAENLATIRSLVEDWGDRMLASQQAKRSHMARIASLASHVPDVSLLPILKRMLDDNLQRYQKLREEAEATGWQHVPKGAREPMTHQYQRAFLAIEAPETTALMKGYLSDPHFGELAAQVLALQWKAKNDPPIEKLYSPQVDFSGVEAKRAVRAANPSATTQEAEAIFSIAEPLIVDGANEGQIRLGTTLGVIAASLPHGQREATIERLIQLTPRRERARLLLNLILSGADIDRGHVTDGIAELYEEAKTKSWLLTQSDGYELRGWLRLLPFTNRPAVALEVARALPAAQRRPEIMEEMLNGLAESPAEDAGEILFKLAEEDPRFYGHYGWRAATLKLGAVAASLRLIDLTASGAFDLPAFDDWHWARELSGLVSEHPEVRSLIYNLLVEGAMTPGLALLAKAVAQVPDAEGILLLAGLEDTLKRRLVGQHEIEKVVTEHVPVEDWTGAYHIIPAPASDLRRRLFAATEDDGTAKAASRYLELIDLIRDEHGQPASEPRHPDLASGRPWPIMVLRQEGEAAN
jgi:hypothetical protein